MQAPNQNDDILKLVDESDQEQNRTKFENPEQISSHSSYQTQKSDTYNTQQKNEKNHPCSNAKKQLGYLVSSLFVNRENNMNLRCCGKKRRYREFLEPSQIQFSNKARESAMTFGGNEQNFGSQPSRISLAVPSLSKSQTEKVVSSSLPSLKRQQTQEEKYLNTIIAKQQRQIEMLMQKSLKSSRQNTNKKPMNFRQVVNKMNGQMQYYEGPPKFLPTSSNQASQNLLNLNSVTEVGEDLPQFESQRIDLVQSQVLDQQKFKDMVAAQNQQIIDQQKKLQSKVKARSVFQNSTPSKQIKKNQNYTEVPQNSQIDDVEMQDASEEQSPQKTEEKSPEPVQEVVDVESPVEQPDEDTREDNNLPELNQDIIKQLMVKETQKLTDILSGDQSILLPMAFNIRRQFGFLKKPVKVFSAQEMNENWQQFLDQESPKISDGSSEAVAIFRPVNGDIELVLIDSDKICKTILTSKKSPEWTDSSQDGFEAKLRSVFEMMNGKKFGTPKIPLFMQKAAAAKPQENIEVTKEAERYSEQVECKSPLFGLFVYFRYYLFQGKYKSMLKTNLNHPRYFEKRDELIEYTNDEKLKRYWACCLLSLIQQ